MQHQPEVLSPSGPAVCRRWTSARRTSLPPLDAPGQTKLSFCSRLPDDTRGVELRRDGRIALSSHYQWQSFCRTASAPQPRRLAAGASDIFRVAATVLVDA